MVFPPALADAVLRELRGEGPTDEPLRVVLADGSALFREGLGRVLDEEGFDVLGRAGDLADLLRLIEQTKPQVVVTDIHLPPGDGPSDLDEVEAIRDRGPGTAILVLSQEVDPEDRPSGSDPSRRHAGAGTLRAGQLVAIGAPRVVASFAGGANRLLGPACGPSATSRGPGSCGCTA